MRHILCTTVNDTDGPLLNGFDLRYIYTVLRLYRVTKLCDNMTDNLEINGNGITRLVDE